MRILPALAALLALAATAAAPPPSQAQSFHDIAVVADTLIPPSASTFAQTSAPTSAATAPLAVAAQTLTAAATDAAAVAQAFDATLSRSVKTQISRLRRSARILSERISVLQQQGDSASAAAVRRVIRRADTLANRLRRLEQRALAQEICRSRGLSRRIAAQAAASLRALEALWLASGWPTFDLEYAVEDLDGLDTLGQFDLVEAETLLTLELIGADAPAPNVASAYAGLAALAQVTACGRDGADAERLTAARAEYRAAADQWAWALSIAPPRP